MDRPTFFLTRTNIMSDNPFMNLVLLICFTRALDHTWRTIIGSAINGGGVFNRDTYYMLRRRSNLLDLVALA